MKRFIRRFPVVIAAALAGIVTTVALGLQEFAFSDYEAELLPAIRRLQAGEVGDFFTKLPGYGGAALIQAPFALAGGELGDDVDLWAWRLQALPGLLLFALLAVAFGSLVSSRISGWRSVPAGAATAALVSGSPFTVRALTVGHPEELMVVALAIGGVALAIKGRALSAGAVVGLAAAAKPWAVVAIPVVLVAAEDRRAFGRCLVAAVGAAVALSAPILLVNGAGGTVAHASTGAIFKPSNVFWFFGTENPVTHTSRAAGGLGFNAEMAPYADRLASGWASRISHPLIILASLGHAAVYLLRPAEARRHADLLLLLAAVLWWRCLLDTWNADYYALGGLTALAGWSALRGRFPVVALVATAAAYVSFRGAVAWWNVSPDAHTAIYLAWALPLGIGMSWVAVAPQRWRQAGTIRTIGPVPTTDRRRTSLASASLSVDARP